MTVTVGYATGVFTVTTKSDTTAADTTPDKFLFTDLLAAAPNRQIQSNTVTVTGIDAPAPIRLQGAGSYSLNGGTFTNQPGTVKLNDKVKLRLTSSKNAGAAVSVTLSIGGVSATWTVTTKDGGNTTTPASDWTQVKPAAALRPSVAGGASYGQVLAAQGDWLWIGAPAVASDGQANRGVAYLWQRTAEGDWKAIPTPLSQGQAGDAFGGALAVHGDWAAVGAPKADLGFIEDFGKLYLYQNQGGVWQPAQSIITPDYLQLQFGGAAALSDAWLAVGAPGSSIATAAANGDGSVYLFSLQNGAWIYQQTLAAPQKAGRFGASLALDGDRLVVGAPTELRSVNDNQGSGNVYAYRLEGNVWTQDAAFPLPNLNAHFNGQLGAAVALQGDTLAVGAPLVSVPDPVAVNLPHSEAGRVFLYAWDEAKQSWRLGGSFVQESEFGDQDHFGTSLALTGQGEWLLVGAPGYEPSKSLSNAGRVSLYQLTASGPVPVQIFDGTGKNQGWGRSAALLPSDAFIGAQNGKVWWYQAK